MFISLCVFKFFQTLFFIVFLFFFLPFYLKAETSFPVQDNYDSYELGDYTDQNDWTIVVGGDYTVSDDFSFSFPYSLLIGTSTTPRIKSSPVVYSFDSSTTTLSFKLYIASSIGGDIFDMYWGRTVSPNEDSHIRLRIDNNDIQTLELRDPSGDNDYSLNWDLSLGTWHDVNIYLNDSYGLITLDDSDSLDVEWKSATTTKLIDSHVEFVSNLDSTDLFYIDDFNVSGISSFLTRIISVNEPLNNSVVTNNVNFDIDFFSGVDPDVATKICLYFSQNNQNLIPTCQDIISNGLLNYFFDYVFSDSGTVFAEVRLLNSDSEIIDNEFFSFHVNEQNNFTPIPEPFDSQCSSPSGITEVFFCGFIDVLTYLFVPSNFSGSMNSIKSTMDNKIPFGYIIFARDSLMDLSESEAIESSDVVLDNPLFGEITFIDWSNVKDFLDNFSDVFVYFVYLAWGLFLFYIVERSLNIFSK